MRPTRRSALRFASILAGLIAGCGRQRSGPAKAAAPPADQWSAYGGDAGGSRYSAANQIDRTNVTKLSMVWTLKTGDFAHKDGMTGPQVSCARCHNQGYKFEATPILAGGKLVVSTPFNRVVAIDPTTGKELWRHDPGLVVKLDRNEGFVSRGVAYWPGAAGATGACSRRIFFGTVDARLLALDLDTGQLCAAFADSGTARLDRDVGTVQVGQYGVTSPPAVVGDVVVVGSSIGDNRRVDLERGVVRAFDAMSGTLRWSWDPIPRSPQDPNWTDWTPEAAKKTGGANAWAPLAAAPERDLVFVPTGSAAPDYYGGERPGSNRFANSVVAIQASTGRIVWDFQAVHHDLWDYDIAAQPSVIDVPRDGKAVPAVVAATKTGFVFLLDRDSGKPLWPVEERPVPASTVPGEKASATQPFPTLPKPLHPLGVGAADLWGATQADLDACKAQFGQWRSGALYAPPSFEGTAMYPGFGGGINWGGVAFDRTRKLLVVNTMRLPMWVKLEPRKRPDQGNQQGTPYTMVRGTFVAPSGLPCTRPPWGVVTAIDLATGGVKWEQPLGAMPGTERLPQSSGWGSINMGGPMVTAGGLVFIAAAADQVIRALDVETGRELWRAKLPAGGQATPMTYVVGGKQYVVIAAGGHSNMGSPLGDFIVAFALP